MAEDSLLEAVAEERQLSQNTLPRADEHGSNSLHARPPKGWGR